MGRGSAVVEQDLKQALESGTIAGAMLDVFETEPLEAESPLWDVQGLFVSPHISGDYFGFEEDMVSLFKDNLGLYLAGESLNNLVNKELGFVSG